MSTMQKDVQKSVNAVKTSTRESFSGDKPVSGSNHKTDRHVEEVATMVKRKRKAKDQPILLRSSAVMLQSLINGVHLSLNGKLLSMLTEQETGASAVVGTFQAIALGTMGGFLLSTGIEFGGPLGSKKYELAGHIGKSSWVLATGFGLIVSIAMLSTPLLLPLMTSNDAANLASKFFLGYAASAVPQMILISSPQIAFQEGEWYLPLLSASLFCIPAAGFSYLLAFPLKLAQGDIKAREQLVELSKKGIVSAISALKELDDMSSFHTPKNEAALKVKLTSTMQQLMEQREKETSQHMPGSDQQAPILTHLGLQLRQFTQQTPLTTPVKPKVDGIDISRPMG